MRNKKVFKENMKLVGQVWLRVIIYYAVSALFYLIVLDDLMGNFLGNTLYRINYSIYYWCVTNKSAIFVIYTFVILTIALYRFFLKRTENEDKLYHSLENILDEDERRIELPEDIEKFAEKINQIKYEYILSRKNAKEAEKKKDDLIMYMAHDLKTPLTSVIGYLTLLNDEKSISQELRDKYTKIALDKSLRVEELTNQFFEITRYNLKDMPINKINIDLSLMFAQLIDEFYPMLDEKKQKLEVHKPETLMYQADGDKLARAFGNLIKNAINYSYENTTITIDITDSKDTIEIVFRNRGITIPQYKLEKIFEQFYRVDESRGTNGGGAGLGLAITKEIIELHGGSIIAKSENEEIEFDIELKK